MVSAQVYVDGSFAVDGDGSGWGTPRNTLQGALNQVATLPSGNRIIYVAAWEYQPTATETSDPRTARFLIPDDTELYGGFRNGDPSVDSRSGLFRQTVLSGETDLLTIPTTTADNAYNVVVVEPGTQGVLIDGFTIRDGNANGSSDPKYRSGAALHVTGNEVTVRNLFAELNVASENGGAIAFDGGFTKAFRMYRSYLSSNRASDKGGALYLEGAAEAEEAGIHGVEPSWIFNSVFYRNLAGEQGVTAVELARNGGGAVFVESLAGGPDLLGALGTSVPDVGLLVMNSIFNDNLCHGGGAAVRLENGGSANSSLWLNCTMAYNQVLTNPPGVGGGGTVYTVVDSTLQPYFINSIVGLTFDPTRTLDVIDAIAGSGSRSVFGNPLSWTLEAFGSDIFTVATGTYPTAGFANFDVPPGYQDAPGRDFRLSAGSALIDAGVDPALTLPFDYPDMNGNMVPFELTPYFYTTSPTSARVVDLVPGGGTLDIGAYERL
ncbi:hypothetical protein Poly30_20510 [Planctomycetes bacterium Poly30]|uniref:Right handed beta helix domain-containing protein n=1 Tax=Saltatorellus ferox TaxID=2528018 RepID=A0A518ER24_9BACT|nr:hypothetical protein Poly30_20510 [Planctomycetes bacterium Poly30]